MPDYQKGKIYKLWSPQGNEIYIGSTINTLANRLGHHKKPSNNCNSKYLFENYTDVRIELIEEYPCNNKMELNKREGEHIRAKDCLNKQIPGRTRQEYREANKEEILEKRKDYYKSNKEKIAEKDKKYYENNIQKKQEYQKEYYESNKGKIAEKEKEKIKCECGCEVCRYVIARHRRSNKHKKIIKQMLQQHQD